MKRTADQTSARLNVARAVREPDRNVRRYDTCLRQPVDLCVEQQADRLEPMLGATQSTQSAVEAKRAPLRTPARLHDGALSHLNRDWVGLGSTGADLAAARTCIGTGLTPATSAPGLGPLLL